MKEEHYKSYSMTLGKLLNIFKPQTVHTSWNYYKGKVICLKHWAQYLVFCNLSLNLRCYRVVFIPLGTQRNYRPRINLRSVVISVSLVICRGCSFSIMIPSSGYELCSKEQWREEHCNPEVRPTFVAPATTLMRWRCLMTVTLGSLERRIALGEKKKLRRSVGRKWEVWGNSLWRWDLGSFQGEMGTFSRQDRSVASWVKKGRVPLHDFGGTYSKTKSVWFKSQGTSECMKWNTHGIWVGKKEHSSQYPSKDRDHYQDFLRLSSNLPLAPWLSGLRL